MHMYMCMYVYSAYWYAYVYSAVARVASSCININAKLAARFPPFPSIGWWFCDFNHRLPPRARARLLSSSQLLLFPQLLFSLLYCSPFLICPHTPPSSRPLYATERTALGGAWSLGCQNGLGCQCDPAKQTNKQNMNAEDIRESAPASDLQRSFLNDSAVH